MRLTVLVWVVSAIVAALSAPLLVALSAEMSQAFYGWTWTEPGYIFVFVVAWLALTLLIGSRWSRKVTQ